MTMPRTALMKVAPPDARPAPRAKRAGRREIARIQLFNPRTIGAVDAAQSLGHALRCRYEAGALIVEAES